MIAAAGYASWARHRISSYSFVSDDSYPRAFPFPDNLLEAYHEYLDVMHPVGPNEMKIHGEYPRLQRHLDVLALLSIAIAAVATGVAIPQLFTSSRR